MTQANTIEDALGEWWIYPSASQIADRVVFGAISSTGDVLACEFDTGTGTRQRVVVGTTGVDDHNCPALWAKEGHRSVLAWTTHGAEAKIYFKTSDLAGSLPSMGIAPLQIFTATTGISYAQIHQNEFESTSSHDVFWCLYRHGLSEWQLVKLTVSVASGTIVFGTPVTLWSTTAQTYLSTAPANDGSTIRVAVGYNPAATRSEVFYFEVDLASGNISSPVDSGISGNLDGTNLPLTDSMPTVLPVVASGRGRRLFYVRPGPISPGIAYAEWDTADPDNATYYTIQLQDGLWLTSSYGVSGARIGYTEGANYIAGMNFPNPCVTDTVAVARVAGGVSSVELYRSEIPGIPVKIDTPAKVSFTRLARPLFPTGMRDDRVIIFGVTYYGNSTFTNYRGFAWLTGGRSSEVRLSDGTRVALTYVD